MKLNVINEGKDSGFGCIVFENNKILMINKDNKWQLPKGRPKKGESPKDTAIRETIEETGILCSILPIAPIMVSRIKSDKINKNCLFFIAKHVGGTLNPSRSEGIKQVKWVPFDKAMNHIIPWQFPAIRYFLDQQENMSDKLA